MRAGVVALVRSSAKLRLSAGGWGVPVPRAGSLPWGWDAEGDASCWHQSPSPLELYFGAGCVQGAAFPAVVWGGPRRAESSRDIARALLSCQAARLQDVYMIVRDFSEVLE